MKELETTINNVQNVLDAINNNKFQSQKEIANYLGLSQTRISQIIKNNINTKEIIVFIEKGYYISTIKNANEIPYINLMKKMIDELKSKPYIYFFSEKWIKYFFGLTPKEITQFKAYAEEYIVEMGIKIKNDYHI